MAQILTTRREGKCYKALNRCDRTLIRDERDIVFLAIPDPPPNCQTLVAAHSGESLDASFFVTYRNMILLGRRWKMRRNYYIREEYAVELVKCDLV